MAILHTLWWQCCWYSSCLYCRATRRLDELMQQLEHAAAVVGDTTLASKFAESRETIRRDIMFAASLYVSP